MNEQSSRTTRSLTADELSVLCWQLSLLSRAGVPWTECAGLLLEDGQPPRVKAALTQLQGPLSEGVPLSSAMEAAGTFPPYLLRMVEIGQLSGRLDQVLSALSDYYRRESATLDAIRRAVTYPAVMAALIALVFLVLVSRVLPVFSQVFSQLGAGLSPVAAALLGSGSTAQGKEAPSETRRRQSRNRSARGEPSSSSEVRSMASSRGSPLWSIRAMAEEKRPRATASAMKIS